MSALMRRPTSDEARVLVWKGSLAGDRGPIPDDDRTNAGRWIELEVLEVEAEPERGVAPRLRVATPNGDTVAVPGAWWKPLTRAVGGAS